MRRLATLTFIGALISLTSAQSGAWQQCGGIGWTGATTCVSGYYCEDLNDYYSQCVPGAASTTVSSVSTVVPPPTSPPTTVPTTAPTTTPTGTPTSPISAPTPSGSQIRADQDPVYHFYLQDDDGTPVLGPESSSGYFTIDGTITLNSLDGSQLFLNVDENATTSYKPLSLDATATTTDWGLEGDTIITTDPRQLNFLACPTSDADVFDVYLQEGNDQPTGATCSLVSLHLPCLC
ncbi:hypothetical protein OBBRIDRAFT_788651 [Obba rivulosa]|uniref:CBM1 domain-containing protein n=1 Tax=Obba rivulosa TaxID=1052685 RepID=A0A8E2J5P9_9APHY|nr:hypothetical protein OBBRIDRAFT_788651 [Obba rivulosa]